MSNPQIPNPTLWNLYLRQKEGKLNYSKPDI